MLVKSLQLGPRLETLCELLDTAIPEARKNSETSQLSQPEQNAAEELVHRGKN